MNQGLKTVGFMVLISVVFITVLASINEVTKATIEQNVRIDQAKSKLYAFNIFPEGVQEAEMSLKATTADIPWQDEQVLSTSKAQIKSLKIPIPAHLQDALKGSFLEGRQNVEIFTRLDDQGKVMSYGLPLSGKGLWGTIEAFGVISADLTHMVGIDFTKQSETPGLGARIMEKEYKYFYRGLDLSKFHVVLQGKQLPVFMVKAKTETNLANPTNSVQAITGATLTSQGVLDMMNSNLALYIKIIQEYNKQES